MNLFQFLNPTVKPPKDVLFERFLKGLNPIFGDDPEFWFPKKEKKDDPLVLVVMYKDVPAAGFITGVTYGLSLEDSLEKEGVRPELCMVIQSKNENWAKALGHLVSRLRGTCPFVVGQIIRFGTPVVEESKMDAFLIGSPIYLEAEENRLNLDADYHIQLQALYPMYEQEIAVCEKMGTLAFMKHPNFDPFDIVRAAVSTDSV